MEKSDTTDEGGVSVWEIRGRRYLKKEGVPKDEEPEICT